MNKIFYHPSVPKSISDLMGDKFYKYIFGHNGMDWPSATLAEPPKMKTERRDYMSMRSLVKGTIEESVAVMNKVLNDPQYISSELDYENEEVYIYVKVIVDSEEQAKFAAEIAEYEKEERLFAQLKELIEQNYDSYNFWKVRYDEAKEELNNIKKLVGSL
jgi:hypothetical protein